MCFYFLLGCLFIWAANFAINCQLWLMAMEPPAVVNTVKKEGTSKTEVLYCMGNDYMMLTLVMTVGCLLCGYFKNSLDSIL